MKTSIKKTIQDTIELLEIFYKTNRYDYDKYKYDEIVQKFKVDTIMSIIQNFKLVVGVSKDYFETDSLDARHIKGIKQKELAVIFLKCLDSKYSNKAKKIEIETINYNKQYFEIEEYLGGLTFLINHTSKRTSKTIEINTLDSIISIDPKLIAKGVKKSLTSTLSGKKDDKYFRGHPETNKRIVPIDELGEYINLKDKHCNIECPICSATIPINSKNIMEKILIVDNYKVKIVCHHMNTDYEEELLFTLEINHDKNKKLQVMYVLNNYNKLIENKKSKIPKT